MCSLSRPRRTLPSFRSLRHCQPIAAYTVIGQVVFNDDLKKSFQKLNSFESKKEAIQTIMYLAEGWRSKKRSVGLSDSFQLTRIYRVKELFLVWSVDIMKDGNYVQVIKVWDILSSSLLMKMISRLDRIFFKYTETFISCCKVICTECSLVRGSIKVPKRWNTEQVILRYKKNVKQEDGPVNNDVLVKSEVSESFFLTKFYASSSGIASHLLTGNDGTELNIPFELTDEEKDAVRFPRSSLILGTSGNRTKLLTTKLVQKQQQNSISLQGVSLSEGCDPKAAFENRLKFEKEDLLKQMFITSSSKLCLATKDHICRLSRFAADGCLYGPPSDIDMQEKDNELSQFMDIPDNFNGLSNEHYPLVITIDKFLMMLDGSVSCSFFRRFQNAICFSSNRSSLSKPFAMEIFIHKQVTYEKFLGSYWPHFNTHLKRKLDASIVYTEIISHIKGSLDGNMGREEYVMLSIKHISPFCKETRKNIYDIFLCYEKKKLLRAEFDISDFVIDLHRRLRCEAYLSAKFDYVYVDEVQDLTMRQINLLKYVCTNYDEGFTFAGDPTPSIASAINFSFGDIPSLLYKKFKSELITENQKIKLDRYHNEDIFHLNQNRRTHSGILKLAKNILNLLYTVLPLSVDKIAETSINSAKSPILFESYTSDDAAISCMYQIEFGAEQVILVRDDLVKRKVIELIGSKALVLTILECKDIEFQDVLLYDFFEQSPIANNWRVVLEHLNKDGLVKLDQSKHNLYCCELTQLYVAITRAKQRLWICDNSSNYGKPMFDYWKSLCLVRVKYLDSSFVKAMGTVSTKDDWKLRGIELFNAQNFEMATLCFEKAGDTYREKWARAAGLVCTGDRLISSKPEMAKSFLKKAASIYESIGKVESAIACCMKI